MKHKAATHSKGFPFISQTLQWLFWGVALIIVVVSVMFTNRLANRLAQEERLRMQIWAEATRQLILADENADITFYSQIMAQNTTIPLYMVDADGNFLLSRNVSEPKHNIDEFYRKKIDHLKRQGNPPIEVRISDQIVQYIYYEDSTLLRQLQYFPYVQFLIIFIFLIVSLYAMLAVQRSQQNRVWVGLSRETAHQLGTPISSLMAWQQLLQNKYPDDNLLPEMQKDIARLQTIAARFSKIGSEPELESSDIAAIISQTIDYMQKRTSQKVHYSLKSGNEPIYTMLNHELFSWVMENLCKNSVDAMQGQGNIDIEVTENDRWVVVDIADTGKGIPASKQKAIFIPGYTTKQRGWGLGLSLAKRIICQYHHGKIFVLHSEQDVGTTFRILLRKNK